VTAGGVIKIADFGRAKILKPGTLNDPAQVTLPYRAPEMCFGNHRYDNKIDMWAIACVFAELMTQKTLFYGGSEGC
jgi:serine/threonine protein kinase